jgi:lysophospholipase L1-like esterase
MKKIQLILIAITAISGCTNGQTIIQATNNTKSAMTATNGFTYLALGDSYTIGESVPQDKSFPYQLSSLLAANSIKIATPDIIAVTGWTTDNLINAIAANSIHTKTYDLVTLLIGVNDQYQGLSQTNYRTKFAQLLATAIGFAKGDANRVFVLSIPDWGVTPYANGQDAIIGPQIDQFNSINKEESKKAGVHYLDITPISRQAAKDPLLVAGDGLHPSAKMYSLWMAQLEPMVREGLTK